MLKQIRNLVEHYGTDWNGIETKKITKCPRLPHLENLQSQLENCRFLPTRIPSEESLLKPPSFIPWLYRDPLAGYTSNQELSV
jgi:hypothetical protein